MTMMPASQTNSTPLEAITPPETLLTASPQLIMLDYDGTLAENVQYRAQTYPHSQALPTVLELLEAGHQVYLVTGRRRSQLLRLLLALRRGEDVTELEKLLSKRIISQHGLDWPNEKTTAQHEEAIQAILAAIPEVPGREVERRGQSLAVSCRAVQWDRQLELRQALEAIELPEGWERVRGRFIHHFRPKGANKGKVVKRLMKRHPDLPAVYIGDGIVDEPAFAAVQDAGGVGIKVGQGDSMAERRVGGVPEVIALLRGLLKPAQVSRSA